MPSAWRAAGLSAGTGAAMALPGVVEGQEPACAHRARPRLGCGQQLDTIPEGRKGIGEGLGAILKAVLEKANLRRAMVAGGDSSSHALGQLDIYALTTRMPLAATPGSPLCTACSSWKALGPRNCFQGRASWRR